jgi:hypothetical protein
MTFDEGKSKFGEDLTVILKLVSCETIICQVISDTEKNLIIKDPYIINTVSEKNGDGIKASTYYADWFLGSMSRIHMIRKDHVMSATIPNAAVGNDYNDLVDMRNANADTTEPIKQEKQKNTFDWKDLNFDLGNDASRN